MSGKFSWPNYPKTEADFERLMQAVDAALSGKNLRPFQRPMHVPRAFWEAFGWGGNVFPARELALGAGFEGDVLIAKAHQWYEQTYGNQLKSEFAIGSAPVRLGNAIWRVRFGVMYGRVRLFVDRNLMNSGVMIGSKGVEASLNVLSAVDELPQGLADRLPETAISDYFAFYVFALTNLRWFETLPRSELLDMARQDFAASTSEVLAHRHGQARWAAQQSAEKTIKGLLAIGNTKFPKSGASGHDLKALGGLLTNSHQISIDASLLEMAACAPRVRYGEVPSTETEGLNANHAVLKIIEEIRLNGTTQALLDSHCTAVSNETHRPPRN